MPKSKLSDADRQDISRALDGLKGPRAAAEVRKLAAFYDVHPARIYEAARRVRPARKKRSDAGRRKVDLMENTATRGIAEFVSQQKASPELAALVVAENEHLFGPMPDLSLGSIRRYLREHGISRRQASTSIVPYRSFEASFPGEIFQFDISGVKERWVDVRTRGIHKVPAADVNANHPNKRADRVPLWKCTLTDDRSRKKFFRFVACTKPNTVHVVEFLKEAFLELGLPLKLYTDNDSVIVNKRTRRGARFLDEAFRDSGGFEMIQHLPYQPQATGKVERAHQVVEEYEKLIGIKIEFGQQPNVDGLNRFAAWTCKRQNARICKAIGVSPNVAWRATTNPFRRIDPAQFDAAFKARDIELRIQADITIRVDGVKYQLSRRDEFPFQRLAVAREKVQVYWMDDDDFFAVVTPAGDQFVVEKIVARPDTAGEFKTLPETVGQKSRKDLKASQRERIKSVKERQKLADEPVLVVPGIDTSHEAVAGDKVLEFPRSVETGDVDRLHELTHQLASTAPEYSRQIDLFDALELLQREEHVPAEPGPELADAKAWLRTVFAGQEVITEAVLMAAFESRQPASPRIAAAS